MLNITNEDCMELMQRYPDGYFDLAIVDPPYGIKAAKSIGLRKKWQRSYNNPVHEKKDWDNKPPTKKYWKQLFASTCSQIVCGANYFPLPPSKGIVAWDKQSDETSFSDFELIWTSFDTAARIFRYPIQGESQRRIHPTQKPVALYKWLLDKYAKPIQAKLDRPMRILDTHLGSGSIAIACHDYGYDLTACELDPEYYQKAMKRIQQHTAQGKLF